MKYTRLVQWSARGDRIHLEMLGEDDSLHKLEIGSECAGALAAALGVELERLNIQGKSQQFIRPKSMQTATTEQGEPMLIMALNGGVELPLVFRPESLPIIVSELQGLLRHVQPGSEIRWN